MWLLQSCPEWQSHGLKRLQHALLRMSIIHRVSLRIGHQAICFTPRVNGLLLGARVYMYIVRNQMFANEIHLQQLVLLYNVQVWY